MKTMEEELELKAKAFDILKRANYKEYK